MPGVAMARVLRFAALVATAVVFGTGCTAAIPKPCPLDQTVDKLLRADSSFSSAHIVDTRTCKAKNFDVTDQVLEVAWAPTGKQVALFAGKVAPIRMAYRLYVLDADKGLPRKIVDGSDGNDFAQGSLGWSPDGRWITYSQSGNLWIAHPDGSGSQQLVPTTPVILHVTESSDVATTTTPEGVTPTNAISSPKRTFKTQSDYFLLYGGFTVTTTPAIGGFRLSNGAVATGGLGLPDGSVVSTLPAFTRIGPYSWSPDSRWLAYELTATDLQDGGKYSHLAVVDISKDLPETRILATRVDPAFDVGWRPGSLHLLIRFPSDPRFRVISASGGGAEAFPLPIYANVAVPEWAYGEIKILWSPDGQKAAFPCMIRSSQDGATQLSTRQVCLSDAQLKNPRPIHEGEAVAWSPDSKWLAVRYAEQFFAASTTGKQFVQMTHYPIRTESSERDSSGRNKLVIESLGSDFVWVSPSVVAFTAISVEGLWHLAARDGSWDVKVGSSTVVTIAPGGRWVMVSRPPYSGAM